MIRKLKILISAILAIITLVINFTVFSDSDIKVIVDGKEVVFDVKPIIIEDRTMVPMRAIFEKLGAAVEWDSTTQTITGAKDKKTIILKVGSNQATVNGEQITLDVAATEIDGRTLVPLRFISESLGIAVRWDNNTNTATINTNILYGTFFNSVGEKYVGEYIINEDQYNPNGMGKIYYSNGKLEYDGEFKNGSFEGFGKVYSQDNGSLIYEGEWLNDKPNGNGKEYDVNGNEVIYEGSFKDGIRSGYGKVYANDIVSSEGEFDGDLVNGKEYYNDGAVSVEKELTKGDNGYNGTVKRFYPDGKILMIAEVKDNLPTINTKYYYKDGSIAYQGEEATKVTYEMLNKLLVGE